MKEHGIIVATSGVQAILEGRKTQTRRVMKPQPELIPADVPHDKEQPYWWPCRDAQSMIRLPDSMGCMPSFCPYGQVGDRLWVRETWAIGAYLYERYAEILYKAEESKPRIDRYFKHTDWNDYLTNKLGEGGVALASWDKWHSSLFMPRWASRITLEITGVRVERLNQITEEDAKAEGVACCPNAVPDYKHHFMVLWDSLNAKRGYGWETNCWVWVIEFKEVHQ